MLQLYQLIKALSMFKMLQLDHPIKARSMFKMLQYLDFRRTPTVVDSATLQIDVWSLAESTSVGVRRWPGHAAYS